MHGSEFVFAGITEIRDYDRLVKTFPDTGLLERELQPQRDGWIDKHADDPPVIPAPEVRNAERLHVLEADRPHVLIRGPIRNGTRTPSRSSYPP